MNSLAALRVNLVFLIVASSCCTYTVTASSFSLWNEVPSLQVRNLILRPHQRQRLQATAAASAIATTPVPYNGLVSGTTSSEEEVGTKNDNFVSSIAKNIRDNLIVFKNNTSQLYANYQTCNDIKRQQREFADKCPLEQRRLRKRFNGTTLGMIKTSSPDFTIRANPKDYYIRTGLSYAQNLFLQQGQQDFNKVVRLAMFAYSNVLVYAFMFFPESVKPSPFLRSSHDSLTQEQDKWHYAVQSRIHGCLATLCDVEHDITIADTGTVVSGGGLSILSLFGGSKNNKMIKQQQQIHFLKALTTNLETKYYKSLGSSSTRNNNEENLSQNDQSHESEEFWHDLASVVCRPIQHEQPFTKAEHSLSDVPPSIIRGLSKMILTYSPANPSPLSAPAASGKHMNDVLPLFFIKNRLVTHLSKIEKQDDFLIYENVSLSQLRNEDVREACHARCIGSSHDSMPVLRMKLTNWLTLEEKILLLNNENMSYYNANLARAYMMCINALQTTADDHNFGKLPRLLYTINNGKNNNNYNRRYNSNTNNE